MSERRRLMILTGSVIVASLVYWLLPSSMGEPARRTCAIFVVAAIFWATEVIPLYATSLCIIGMQILFLASNGGLAQFIFSRSPMPEDMHFSTGTFLEPFSSSIIILFMGGFLLSAAVSKHGLDQAIAARIIRPFAGRPVTLIFAILLITAFFSMWMSNTATTVMMIAIIAPLLKGLPEGATFRRAVILAVPFGANIGGIGTPIGTPPNAVAMAALEQAGMGISFLDWMLMAVPLAVLLLAVSGGLLLWFYRPEAGMALPQLEAPAEKISGKGKATLAIILIAMLLWLTGAMHGLSSAAVALLAAAALTSLGVLDKKDVDSIDWNILILMWGGLSLGKGMEVTGLIDYIASLPISSMSGFPLAFAIVLMGVVMSTFMSNTATANVLVPMVMAIGASQAAENPGAPITLAILTALSCSFAMAMPVSTPPNAIAFGTGQLPAITMIRAGGIVSVICVVALLIGYQFVIPLFISF